MSRGTVSDRGALAFAEQLLTLLGEGRFTATYKYAVVLALMDLCLEHSTRTGAAPSSVTTRQLAEKIIELYWSHTRPFEGEFVLSQVRGGQAKVLQHISDFRETVPTSAGASMSRARLALKEGWKRLVQQVEWVLVQMPLPKLQRLGSGEVRFIYEITWGDGVKKGQLRSSDFDNLIRFVGDSGDHLVRLAGLIRPLVCREWAAQVAHLNKKEINDPELDQFLFGRDRSSLTPVRGPLRELQNDRCFYCHDRLSGSPQVDHFVPWARYPDDSLDNLVVAHAKCNGAKGDHLAAMGHVAAWVDRFAALGGDLGAIALEVRWPRQPDRSMNVARSIYLGLPEEAQLWNLADEFVVAGKEALRDVFSRVS